MNKRIYYDILSYFKIAGYTFLRGFIFLINPFLPLTYFFELIIYSKTGATDNQRRAYYHETKFKTITVTALSVLTLNIFNPCGRFRCDIERRSRFIGCCRTFNYHIRK